MNREALTTMIIQKYGTEAPQTQAFMRMCKQWTQNAHNDEIVYNSYVAIMTHTHQPLTQAINNNK